jgi:AcrR family transcriptional regulator
MRQDERQAQVLAAAAVAFARGGFAATSMDDVAAEAGITRLIVYRHFESKEELYRAVLAGVTERIRDEFLAGMARAPEARRGFVVGSLLAAAREDPDAFRLLMVHAAREPRFAAHHDEWWSLALGVADLMVGETIGDPGLSAWATRTLVATLVDTVLAWLDAGDRDRDGEFVARATDGMEAMFRAWTATP